MQSLFPYHYSLQYFPTYFIASMTLESNRIAAAAVSIAFMIILHRGLLVSLCYPQKVGSTKITSDIQKRLPFTSEENPRTLHQYNFQPPSHNCRLWRPKNNNNPRPPPKIWSCSSHRPQWSLFSGNWPNQGYLWSSELFHESSHLWYYGQTRCFRCSKSWCSSA